MIPKDIQPFKVAPVGSRLGILEAYRQDLDFWGNGERKLYHTVTKSLAEFLVKNVASIRDNTMTFWCDIGCGAGYFLEGLSATMREQGPVVIPSGVDISPEALARCRGLWPSGEFTEVNLDGYKRTDGNLVMPWINADVISMIDTLQILKDYRKTFNEIYDGLKPGTIIVIGDGMGRSNLRNYPASLDTVAFLGGWVDYSTAVTPRDPSNPKSKNQHLKYRIYRKML